MSQWTEYAPASGWASFSNSAAMTDALWDRLPPESWLYLNLATSSSVWESLRDSSMVSVHYEGERLIHFAAEDGVAGEFASLLAAEFGLVPTPTQEAERAAPDPAV
jgi:hypothetical protein